MTEENNEWTFVRPDVSPGELVLIVGKEVKDCMVLGTVADVREDNSLVLTLPFYKLRVVNIGGERFPSFSKCEDEYTNRRRMKNVRGLIKGSERIAEYLGSREEFKQYAEKIRNTRNY